MTEKEQIPKEVLIRFEKRMNTLRSMPFNDPHKAHTTASYAAEFNSYPDLKLKILASASDSIRGHYNATVTAKGGVRN